MDPRNGECSSGQPDPRRSAARRRQRCRRATVPAVHADAGAHDSAAYRTPAAQVTAEAVQQQDRGSPAATTVSARGRDLDGLIHCPSIRSAAPGARKPATKVRCRRSAPTRYEHAEQRTNRTTLPRDWRNARTVAPTGPVVFSDSTSTTSTPGATLAPWPPATARRDLDHVDAHFGISRRDRQPCQRFTSRALAITRAVSGR